MSIPVLIQTYDEVRRLAIAGSVVAPGDFRLKKLAPQLIQAGQKVPVFARVGEAVARLVESSEKTSAMALLELISLVNAILYTQGETGVSGELTPIKTIELIRSKTQTSARVLKPLQEALTTTGSGRLEIIRDAFERGACHDFRLMTPAITALDDSFSEIAEFAAQKILPLFGQAIVSELQATFEAKGRMGHVRRLLLMHRLDQELARPLVKVALEEGSKEVRIAAIRCLGDSPEDLPFLLEQAKSKAREVRTAALNALGKCSSDDAVKVLCKAIQSEDLALAVEPLRASRNTVVTAVLLEAAEKQIATALSAKEDDAKKLGKQNERICLLLECLRHHDDARTEKLLLHMFARIEEFARIKGEPGGKDIVEKLLTIMLDGPRTVQSALVDAHETLSAESLGYSFVAACRSRVPADVFSLFSPYFTAKIDETKKNRDLAYTKREAIIDVLAPKRRMWFHDFDHANSIVTSLDPRWQDLAVATGRFDLVQFLARPGHAGSSALLASLFQDKLGKPKDEHELARILDTMIRIGHPEATDAAIDLVKKFAAAKTAYGFYWISHLLPRLPKAEAVPKLEALLPTLPEKLVDQVLDIISAMK
jgi:HEAT repeats